MDRQMRASTTAAKRGRFWLALVALAFGALAGLFGFGDGVGLPVVPHTPITLFAVLAIGYALGAIFIGLGSKIAWLAATIGNAAVLALAVRFFYGTLPHSLISFAMTIALLLLVSAALLSADARAVFASWNEAAPTATPDQAAPRSMSSLFTWPASGDFRDVPGSRSATDVLPVAPPAAPPSPGRWLPGGFGWSGARCVATAVAAAGAFTVAVAASSTSDGAAHGAVQAGTIAFIPTRDILPRTLQAVAAQRSVLASLKWYGPNGQLGSGWIRVNGDSTEESVTPVAEMGTTQRDTPAGHFIRMPDVIGPGSGAFPTANWVHCTTDPAGWRRQAVGFSPLARLTRVQFVGPVTRLHKDSSQGALLGVRGTAGTETITIWVNEATLLPVEMDGLEPSGLGLEWSFARWGHAAPVRTPAHWVDRAIAPGGDTGTAPGAS